MEKAIIFGIVAIAVGCIVALITYTVIETHACQEKGGLRVRTTSGYDCIEAKVIK